ncbi:hypothetical protein [Nostoc linckia]|uniref:hypothetical protein n=1 Tax=Nostoc linckia TaxID=92942 RepID=UPI00117EB49E|nr:hypothetical protein [Nostoc linckia]
MFTTTKTNNQPTTFPLVPDSLAFSSLQTKGIHDHNIDKTLKLITFTFHIQSYSQGVYINRNYFSIKH